MSRTTSSEIDKQPLDRETLRDVIDLSLWVGQMLLHNGADSARIEETVHQMGTALGANWMDVVVTPEALIVTTISGEEFRTKVRRVVSLAVNFAVVDAINTLSRRVTAGELDRFAVRAELIRIDNLRHGYNRWSIVIMVGLACAAFAQLFGGDLPALLTTFAASSLAMFVRQQLVRLYFNPLLVVALTAFTAGAVASLPSIFGYSTTPQAALAASVLLLVPGVHLINAVQDILKGHLLTGVLRGVFGAIISLCIALGLLLALRLLNVTGF